MKTKLILLDNPIIVSDEEIKDGECCINIQNGVNENNIHYAIKEDCNTNATNCHKIIAGIDNLPEIDFNGLEGEFGWIDVEKFASEKYSYKKTPVPYYKQDLNYEKREGFIEGFEKAQSLNEKKFSLEDMRDAYRKGEQSRYSRIGEAVLEKSFIQSLQQPKVFDIEIEMELDEDLALQQIQADNPQFMTSAYIPKITNNKIKILKKL